MKTKRIGLVLSNVPGYSETFFRNKIKGLQEHGFEVILFVSEPQSKAVDTLCEIVYGPNFNSHLLKKLSILCSLGIKALFLYPMLSYRLFRLDKKDGHSLKTCMKQVLANQYLMTYDLDWLHFGFGMLAVGRENVAEAINAKMAVSFRGFDLYLSPLKHNNCYNLLFTKDVKYHVLSEEMKVDLMTYNVPNQHIEVITPAIDVGFFKTPERSGKTKVIKMLTVARLHWKKGLEYTLEALHHLKQDGVKFQYIIVGAGSELERLKFATYQLDLLDCVTFKGKCSHAEVKSLMEASDVYLQYSIQEGFCNAVLEAQSMGMMCIVSDAEGLSENVLNGKTGWVVPKRNPMALKHTIEAVMRMTSEEHDLIRKAAVNRVKKEFNILKQQKEFVSFYEN